MADFNNSDEVARLPVDPFRPIVTLTPIAGFPEKVVTESLTGSGAVHLSIGDRLQSFVLTDNDKKIDVCDITFIDEEGLFTDPEHLMHGAVLDIAWGYPGHLSQSRRLVVRRIKLGMVQGRKFARRRRGFLVTFQALALGVVKNQKHASAPIQNDLYENMPLLNIVRDIAQKNGYHEEADGEDRAEILIPHELNDVRSSITRVAAETYRSFLVRIAHKYGLICNFDSKTGLYFGPRKVDAPSSFVVDMEGDHLIGFDLDGDLVLGAPAGLTVVGVRPSDRKIIKVVVPVKAQDAKHGRVPPIARTTSEAAGESGVQQQQQPVESTVTTETLAVAGSNGVTSSQALRMHHVVYEDFRPAAYDNVNAIAQRNYFERIKKTWKLNIRLVGTVEAKTRRTILLQNFGTAILDGLWYVKECKHTVDSGGYITELKCRRGVGAVVSAHKPIQLGYSAVPTKGKKGEIVLQETQFIISDVATVTKQKHKKTARDLNGQYFSHRYDRDK